MDKALMVVFIKLWRQVPHIDDISVDIVMKVLGVLSTIDHCNKLHDKTESAGVAVDCDIL